jgi:hypothetical protein
LQALPLGLAVLGGYDECICHQLQMTLGNLDISVDYEQKLSRLINSIQGSIPGKQTGVYIT